MRTITKRIKVEKGIPIPALNPNQIIWKPALEKLESMDSFVVGTKAEAMSALRAARKIGLHVTSRKINEGIRIWRVE